MPIHNYNFEGGDQRISENRLKVIREDILKAWETRVREDVSVTAAKNQLFLRNLMPELLYSIATDCDNAARPKPAEIGKAHGEEWANMKDCSIDQVLNEYRVLRQVIYEILEKEKIHEQTIRHIILNDLDEIIQKTVENFSATRLKNLEKSNIDLEHFAATAAHDLKSPLATIAGYMDLLEADLKDKIEPADAEFIQAAKRSTTHLAMLINRLLEYSSLDKNVEKFAPVENSEVVKQVIEDLDSAIKSSGAKIILGKLPRVNGDAFLLSELFQNLVANAIKFRDGQRSLEISIEAKEELNNWVFSVRDNGIGIKSENLDSLFNLFIKVHTEQTHMGYGIGLATAKKIVEIHGGRIWVVSQWGVGTTFFFTLPK